MSASTPIPFDTEATVQGQQVLVPGVRPVSMKARLEALAAHPMGSDRLQKPCDLGLFDEVARNQMELFSAITQKT
ncbi:MAG: hypothetical protein M3O03_11785 [Pseudomonadota bacterium]|nr:hypothetical protein [Pseudomonadota bacterium]